MASPDRKRRWAFAVIALLSPSLLGACDWSMFRSGAAHTGESVGETSIGVGNVSTLHEVWDAQPPDADFDTEAELQGPTDPPVVAGGRAYVQRKDGFLWAYPVRDCYAHQTTAACPPVWRAPINEGDGVYAGGGPGTPAVAAQVVYVANGPYNDGILSAFDATGTTGCSGTPLTCQALWTARPGVRFVAPPTVSGGIVYLAGETSSAEVLFAFDAAGVQGCGGAPKVCAPLWSATFGSATRGGDDAAAPAVAGGRVFVSGSGPSVSVFDAAGEQNCSGSPKHCSALWTDAVPITCTAFTGTCVSAPAVAQDHVYVTAETGNQDGTFGGGLFAFDENGDSCPGTPKVCAPSWSANAMFGQDPPAIAGGVVYAVGFDPNFFRRLWAFDAAGVKGCTSGPALCQPLWKSRSDDLRGSPAVANGVVYVTNAAGTCENLPCEVTRSLHAYDAAGVQGCGAITPMECDPLVYLSTQQAPLLDDFDYTLSYTDPAVANGTVYVGDGAAGMLRAFTP